MNGRRRPLALSGHANRGDELAKKTEKNTDLWEENYHSGPVEKAGEIFHPLPGGTTSGTSPPSQPTFRDLPMVGELVP